MILIDAFLIDEEGHVSALRKLHIQQMYFRNFPIPADAGDKF
jgi:hypothetical protein